MSTKTKMLLALTVILMGIAGNVFAQFNDEAILGVWMSAKKDTKFQIFKQGSKFYGKIIWGTGSAAKDIRNPDEKLRDRDVVGLVILNDFIFDGSDTWEKGTIYDPREGKTYSCKLSLKSDNQLSVRGFVGISLFGRTEVWTKMK